MKIHFRAQALYKKKKYIYIYYNLLVFYRVLHYRMLIAKAKDVSQMCCEADQL